jgi:hypothetical protein
MKPANCLKALFFLIAPLSLLGQINTETTKSSTTITSEQINALPYAKGNWNFLFDRKLDYSNLKNSSEGNNLGSTTDFDLNLGTNYFVANHFAVGLDIGYKNLTDKIESGTNPFSVKDTKWDLNGSFTYMNQFTPNFFYYARAGVGFGSESNGTSTGGSSVPSQNIFDYKGEIGFPFHPCQGPGYVTPYLGYKYFSTSYSGIKTTDYKFEFGIRLETYLPSKQFCSGTESFSKNMYDAGRNIIGFSTKTSGYFGTETVTEGSGTYSSKTKTNLSDFRLQGDYQHYFWRDIGLGASLDFGTNTQKLEDGDKTNKLSILITPMVELHLPVKNNWESLYIQGGYGFGQMKTKATTQSQSTTQTQNLGNFCIGAGYDFHIARNISFTVKGEYDMNSIKDTETHITEKQKGFELSFGIRYSF